MSTPKEIFNEVVSILRSDATLGAYVEAIYERERDNVEEGKRVVIMVEPSETWEIDQYWPTQEVFVIAIVGWIVEADPDKAINDGATKQILDLEYDIKYALYSHPGLNDTCDSFVFYTSKFDRRRRSYGVGSSLRRPPEYGVEIFMEVFYPADL
jgi:hypothetical protein